MGDTERPRYTDFRGLSVRGITALQCTFVSPSAFSRRAVVSYWRKYVHEVLVNRLGGLSLPRKSVVRLTDRPDMTFDFTVDVKQQYNQQPNRHPVSQGKIGDFIFST